MQERLPESRGERYRRLARECFESAKAVQTQELRLVLIEMAQAWRRLADEKQDD